MDNSTNYLSCIKIPPINSKQAVTTMFSQKFNIDETLTLNNELISLANRIFGEGKWCHSITNQTIDFVEAFMGKYVCGCVTFIKIQLQNGTFHEDMGYCHAEGSMKGLSIYYARTGSLVAAFKKVLLCFGNTIEIEVQKLTKKLSNSHTNDVQNDLQLSNVQLDVSEPSTHSTLLVTCKNDEQKDKVENICQPKSPHHQEEQTPAQQTMKKLKSSPEQKSKNSNDMKCELQSNELNNQKGHDIVHKEENQKKVLTEEELLRIERKRKQMEKQAEFKRLMKEKEQQKVNENRKPNPKY